MITAEHTPAPVPARQASTIEIDRAPFTKRGEVVVRQKETLLVPERGMTHAMDKTFEVAAIVVTLTALAEGAVCDPQPTVLDRLLTIEVMDMGRNQPIGTLILAPESPEGTGVYCWTLKKPIVMRRGDALQFRVVGRDSFDVAFDGVRKRIDAIRVEVALEGELVQYADVKFEGEAPLPG